jgi:hypothetical protein
MATTVDNPGVVYDWGIAGATTVVGPASATNNSIAIFDGTTGKLLKSTTNILFDGTGKLTFSGSGTVLAITSTQAATTIATGAFTCEGGMSCKLNFYCGGLIAIKPASGNTNLLIDAVASGNSGGIQWRTGTSARWVAIKDTASESGANAGSGWALQAYTDAGALIDSVIAALRAAGATLTLGGSTSRSVATTGGRIKKVTTVTDTVTLDSTYHHLLCNKASAMTVNLPAAASNSGREYYIKNINTGVVTIDANASETIDGATTYALSAQYQSVLLVCNGTSWDIY